MRWSRRVSAAELNEDWDELEDDDELEVFVLEPIPAGFDWIDVELALEVGLVLADEVIELDDPRESIVAAIPIPAAITKTTIAIATVLPIPRRFRATIVRKVAQRSKALESLSPSVRAPIIAVLRLGHTLAASLAFHEPSRT